MMERVFVDTNVILDILQRRDGLLDALRMVMSARRYQMQLVTSTVSMVNVAYALRHQYKGAALCNVLDMIGQTVSPISVSSDAYQKAIKAEWKDFEDSVQHYAAIEANCICIITGNVKDFRSSSLPVIKPSQFVSFVEEHTR